MGNVDLITFLSIHFRSLWKDRIRIMSISMFLLFHMWLPLEVIVLHNNRMIFHRGWEGVIKNLPLRKERRNWLNGLPICSVGLALTLQTVFVGLRLEFKTDLSMVLFACFLVNKALRKTMVQIPLTQIHVVIGGSECRRGMGEGWGTGRQCGKFS